MASELGEDDDDDQHVTKDEKGDECFASGCFRKTIRARTEL
jgi:hypothetical protein